MFRSLWIVELAVLCMALGARAQSGGEGLSSAIVRGDLVAVERMLSAGTDVNQADSVGSTPLMVAVLARRDQIVEFLLSHGADPNVRQRQSGSTALRYAVIENRADLARALLAHGANVTVEYPDGETLLHLASEHASAELVGLLCAAQANKNAVNAKGNTPLDEAVLRGRTGSVIALLRYLADARRVRVSDGRGPVHEACIEDYGALIGPLVEAGADPSLEDRTGQTPLDLALDYKSDGAVKALLKLAPGRTALQANFESAMESAVVRGRTARAALLLDAGFPATQATREGSHYLNDAALKGQLNVARLLLDHGATADTRNQNGGTALHDAATEGDTAVIALLLDRGAAIDARETATGATPLMLAASLARTGAVSLLLARGANAALRDNAGRTALSRARELEEPDLVKLLEKAAEKPGGQARTT
ncbi:MAG TPA: ankyrin repeat domain-containing protein [Bryobacteraceae bacterium]|nr:ankyrin repeat domain-containing protein [Bryobacteraceae bacterium]